MKVKVYLAVFLILSAFPLQAAFIFKNGKIYDADKVATMSVQDHFSAGIDAMNHQNWDEASKQFGIVIVNFPDSSYALDSHYYYGISLFNLHEYDLADIELTHYLKNQSNPKFFEQTIRTKYEIANCFKEGARKHLLGYSQMPKWASGYSLAVKIYDEVIAALPCHDLAAQALFSKAEMHWILEEYKEAIECYHSLIKRFPKHELAPKSYLLITEVYLDQCQVEFQNPDLLALAQITVRRFGQDFPREEALQQAEANVGMIKEVYAKGLYDTGQFYERVKKPQASILYYRNAIQQFPDTQIAVECQKRLEVLSPG